MLMLINYIYIFNDMLQLLAVPRSISRRGRITLVPANNAKVIARYCISRKNGTIQINKFSLLVAMHPYWKNWRHCSTHALPRHRRALPFHWRDVEPLFLLFCLIADSLNGLTVCPSSHTQLKSEPCLMVRHRKRFAPFLTVFYTTVCDYCIAHSFVEGSLIVVSRY